MQRPVVEARHPKLNLRIGPQNDLHGKRDQQSPAFNRLANAGLLPRRCVRQ